MLNNFTAMSNASSTVETLTTSATASTDNNSDMLKFLAALQTAVQTALLTVVSVGVLANGFVLFGLLFNKDSRGKTVNVFICNQTVLDLCASGLLTFRMSVAVSGFTRVRSGLARILFCYLFQSEALITPSTFGSIAGLVVITLERYVKVVHPVRHRKHFRTSCHRKYFRRWMQYLGVAIPWLNGFLTGFLPDIVSTNFENGVCNLWIWPNVLTLQAIQFFLYVWRFVIPIAIFIFCYGQIIAVVRRQARVAAVHVQPAGGGSNNKPQQMNSTQRNVIKTMLCVTVGFVVCWMPLQVYLLILYIGNYAQLNVVPYTILGTLVNANSTFVNPLIYASQYHPPRYCINCVISE